MLERSKHLNMQSSHDQSQSISVEVPSVLFYASNLFVCQKNVKMMMVVWVLCKFKTKNFVSTLLNFCSHENILCLWSSGVPVNLNFPCDDAATSHRIYRSKLACFWCVCEAPRLTRRLGCFWCECEAPRFARRLGCFRCE